MCGVSTIEALPAHSLLPAILLHMSLLAIVMTSYDISSSSWCNPSLFSFVSLLLSKFVFPHFPIAVLQASFWKSVWSKLGLCYQFFSCSHSNSELQLPLSHHMSWERRVAKPFSTLVSNRSWTGGYGFPSCLPSVGSTWTICWIGLHIRPLICFLISDSRIHLLALLLSIVG
jgi:hypothetical protein